ncbi:hypothetical protein LCGC14_1682200 [marine sediment metagenome]|uniref:Class I SAM-dependent methyltransferase n=1 Tax=marine sediment metagenome TaxID=412755 RepID=A0A0F9KNA2_9ZZZZ
MKIVAILPKLFDYLVSAIIEGLYENNVKIITSEHSNNARQVYSKKEIIKYSPLIEIGAGTGYWAYLINKYEGDIIAFDNNEWKNYFKKTFYSTKWFDVKFGVENQVKKYPERTLFLCWIDSSSKMGLTCLKLYTGTYFIHIGESKGLCCATDSFFKYLNKKFQLVKDISIPQWHGCHDYLEIYKRK